MAELIEIRLGSEADYAQLPAFKQIEWQPLEDNALHDPSLCLELRQLLEQSGNNCLFHDPIWFGFEPDDSPNQPRVGGHLFYVGRTDGKLIGYAPLTRGTRPLRFAVGEITVFRRPLRSLTLVHDFLANGGPELRRELARALLDTFSRRLGADEGVFLDGLPTSSVLLELIANSTFARQLLTIRLGDPFEHQFARLPASFRDYEAQLGSHSRLNLRHRRKRLLAHVSGELRTARYTEISGIEEFITAAQKISQTTYQWRLLGLGLRDRAELRGALTRAARHGWLRSYILYCRSEPVAFMLGYLYRRTYHYMDVGYDPAWAKWGVGSILQMDVMKDLIEDPQRPEIFDFSTGYGDHKARFGNTSRTEINLLLLRNTTRNALLASGYAASAALDKHAGGWLDKIGLKATIKRWVRRKA